MRLPWHQHVKMGIVGVTLLPLRLVFTVLNVLVMWVFAWIVLAGLSGATRQQGSKVVPPPSAPRPRHPLHAPLQAFFMRTYWGRSLGWHAKEHPRL